MEKNVLAAEPNGHSRRGRVRSGDVNRSGHPDHGGEFRGTDPWQPDLWRPPARPTSRRRMSGPTARGDGATRRPGSAGRYHDAPHPTDGVPITTLTLVNTERQWLKSRQGLAASENPLVMTDPGIRVYAGGPIRLDGQAIGMFCVIDTKPRESTANETDTLRDFRRMAEQEIAAGRAPGAADRGVTPSPG